MQKLSLTLFSLMIIVSLNAQQRLPVFDQTCGYVGEIEESELYGFNSDSEAQGALKRIMRYTGLPANFQIMAANVPNAAAVIKGDTRYILYNQYFMEQIKDLTKTNWSSISILAHEIGHHLSGHTLDNIGSRPDKELESDGFSGFILYKMGATLDEARAVMNTIGGAGTSTHPPKSARLSAITNGWISARDLDEGIDPIEKKPVVTKPSTNPNPVVTKPVEPDPAPADVENVSTFDNHYIISSSAFPNIKKGWDKGYHYKDAVNYMNKWYAIMAVDDAINLQSWFKYSDFPGEKIKEKWDAEYRISNVDSFEGQWIVIMDKKENAPMQRWQTRVDFPTKEIDDNAKEGYMIQDVTYNETAGLWALISTKGDWQNQNWFTKEHWADLKDEIKTYWDKNYYISTLKYVHDRWVLVMTEYKTNPGIRQRWNSSASFLKEKIGDNEKEGFRLKELTYGEGLWISVMNAKTN
ncbi:MAG: hypothetical protein COW03_11315 [Cytophagales bacterium CG12_big_fil_rev_8_21_14_0_65_40_12]|nr:MAG: hypothetical protein COW03_11315 [Cytophagales bacterium CG12_big_fil_rev_8_21_14_0_65_40_12]PIW03539.1 MAG: hypothetical protein COW40_14530 [Cytophagales bacterium CG17_big_fil_post_rev_8_21_14_2_50_40_13]